MGWSNTEKRKFCLCTAIYNKKSKWYCLGIYRKWSPERMSWWR